MSDEHDEQQKSVLVKAALVTREYAPPLTLPRLSLIVHHQGGAEVVPLAPRARIVVGRVAEADISIPDPTLSRQHARIECVGDDLWVEDLGSSNGTLVNGSLIDRHRLSPGDEIHLGNVTIAVHAPASFSQELEHGKQFRLALEEEVTRAATFGHQFALLMVTADGSRTVSSHSDRDALKSADWRLRVRQTLRSVDRVAQQKGELIEVLLPETDRSSAKQRARAVLGAAPHLRCVVACFPTDGRTAAELVTLCERGIQHANEADPLVTCGAIEPPTETSLAPIAAPIVIRGEAMRAVYRTAERVANAPSPILLVGETGTGKEIIARAIHDASPRRRRTMHSLNCGAIPRELVTSMLFGHERGTFTGAHQRHKGVFEEAHGSTLLLDEIGELPHEAQVALLRVLETGRFTRLGSTQETPVDVRVLSATHRDLDAMCEAGTFRHDLLFRLNTVTIAIPPLRQRTDEVEALARTFIDAACRHAHLRRKRLLPSALTTLERYQWPGNVRELRNAMERAVLVSPGDDIATSDLPDRVRTASASRPHDSTMMHPSDPTPHAGNPRITLAKPRMDFKSRVRDFERAVLRRALDQAGWNKTHAAKDLQMPLRTLMHKVAAYDLNRESGPETTVQVMQPLDQSPNPFKEQVHDFESKLIAEALLAATGNRAQAARALGLPLSTLLYKTRNYGISE
ncbi:MAG: sigma 54-interacting transcriptional regulator [Deltaproteobacteria bacterium]|nr:sigma 54-interacting transcriptional regulator [Deltaproteobacteria bacterium]